MLDVLVASRPSHAIRSRWLSGSVLAHLVIFWIAVEGSRVEARSTTPVVADTTLLFLPRLAPPPVEAPARPRATGMGGVPGGTGTVLVDAEPPPRGFQTVIAPTDIPGDIPPIDLSQPALDPRNYTGQGREGGVAWGVEGGTAPVDPTRLPPGAGAEGVVYASTLDDVRFEPAQLVSLPVPQYPPAMQSLGMSGRVVIQFIIDTTGLVEVRSIRVLESTHEQFEGPARASVARAVFRPARLGPAPVRQLTNQPIRFLAQQ